MGEGFEVATGAVGELFWNIPDGVAVCRPGQVMAWSPGAEAITGLPAAEAVAMGSDLAPAFGAATDRFWRLVGSGGGKDCLECTGGNERILEASAWHLGGEDASPVVVVLRDVTDEWRQRNGLRRLNVLARQLLAEPSLDVLLVRIVDAAKELARADFSALLLLREGTEDEVAHFAYNAPRELFPTQLPRAVGLLALPLRSGAVVRVDEIRGHPAGVGIPVEHPPIAALLAAPILMGDIAVGELAVANGPNRPSFDDVDEAIIVELAGHAALAVSLVTGRDAQPDAVRRVPVDVVLQDIRTPLTVAAGFVAQLREQGEELLPEERDRAFEGVERALERIEALAEGVAVDERITATGPAADRGYIRVSDLLDELVGELAHNGRDVRLEVAVEPGTPATFVSDRRLAREVLDNLVGNALKHSDRGGVVTITAREEGGSVRFDVTDRGPGVPPDEQGRVFEQFYRTRQSVADDVPGAGLGLWIARRLAQLLGAAMGLSSRPGQGSTFWVTFPRAPADRRAAEAS
ncbi:MAG: GAF domain-containing sensor histidine kinase [Actinomycetota bacterium]|nr:GAF domain-containing sensor histidine kinase [Actinomycetota bacterium]